MKLLHFYFLLVLSVCLFACKKDKIAPANQEAVFVKYFGYVNDQEPGDIIRTADNGFLMLGTTSSFTTDNDYTKQDFYVVRADSLGNELWSRIYSKPSSENYYYNEQGVKIIERTDASGVTIGYILLGNRTTFETNDITKSFIELNTKIIAYDVDLEGLPVSGDENGYELRSSTSFSDRLSDAGRLLNPDGSLNKVVLVGQTTDVIIKNGQTAEDETDILILTIESDLSTTSSNLNDRDVTGGFTGRDNAVRISVPNETDPSARFDVFLEVEDILTQVGSSNVTEIWALQYGLSSSSSFIEAQQALQLNQSEVELELNDVTLNPSLEDYVLLVSSGSMSLGVITLDAGNFAQLNTKIFQLSDLISDLNGDEIEPQSIIYSPLDDAYLISYDEKEGNNSIIHLAKYKVEEDWGKSVFNRTFGAQNRLNSGSQILAISKKVAGTSQENLEGFALTGKFDLATNTMIGLVKVNVDGNLEKE